MAKTLTQDKRKTRKAVKQEEKEPRKQPGFLTFLVKSTVLSLIVAGSIYYMDSKGYFNPNMVNNHTVRKWNAFYEFTEKNNVDVLLVGNSHLYTGINPKHLSASMGLNAFILASPGTHIGDTYYGLKEALERCKPSVVVVETYGISEFDPYDLKDAALSDQIKSFAARKDLGTKLESTPALFAMANYPYAWSTTLRNHDFYFSNPKQLEKNKEIMEKEEAGKLPKKKGLYLGRYVRFKTGIKDSLLNLYKEKGAPVDGNEYEFGESAGDYLERIKTLCREQGIQLVFLTLPMYHEHVSNYTEWRNKLAVGIGDHAMNWLDLQQISKDEFGAECFENTYNQNQHMTYLGSLKATYMLKDFIRSMDGLQLPDRSNETAWTRMFYGEEGYFHNHPVQNTDKKNTIVGSNVKLPEVTLKEVIITEVKKSKNKQMIAKVVPDAPGRDLSDMALSLWAVAKNQEGKSLNVRIDLMPDEYSSPNGHQLFQNGLTPIKIERVVQARMVPKSEIAVPDQAQNKKNESPSPEEG